MMAHEIDLQVLASGHIHSPLNRCQIVRAFEHSPAPSPARLKVLVPKMAVLKPATSLYVLLQRVMS
jgi:hypothetical protein